MNLGRETSWGMEHYSEEKHSYTQCKLKINDSEFTTYIPTEKAVVGKHIILEREWKQRYGGESNNAVVIEVYENTTTELSELEIHNKPELDNITTKHKNILDSVLKDK